ncbi:MAG: VOC family protein [Flavobacteriaceae bacterium]|nr:VOC family protein [Flavobacteriaceae bacterium]
MKANMVAWFEIPVNDMDRAKGFYDKVFNISINIQEMGDVLMGFFPSIEEGPGAMGSLVKEESYIPSHEGTVIYFSSDDLQIELDKVESAGGKIIQEKTRISPDHGYMGVFQDSEGNRIALYSHP